MMITVEFVECLSKAVVLNAHYRAMIVHLVRNFKCHSLDLNKISTINLCFLLQWMFSVWGACSHCFHMHCIVKWLNSQPVGQQCPMCRQQWKFNEKWYFVYFRFQSLCLWKSFYALILENNFNFFTNKSMKIGKKKNTRVAFQFRIFIKVRPWQNNGFTFMCHHFSNRIVRLIFRAVECNIVELFGNSFDFMLVKQSTDETNQTL